jgi:hypothetical protein
LKAKFKIGDTVVVKAINNKTGSIFTRMKIVEDKVGFDKNQNKVFNGLYECSIHSGGKGHRFTFLEDEIELAE